MGLKTTHGAALIAVHVMVYHVIEQYNVQHSALRHDSTVISDRSFTPAGSIITVSSS